MSFVFRDEKAVGVTQDHNETLTWFRKAAELGDADAQFKLSLMYGKGQGVSSDYIEAYKWCILAAEQGHEKAIQLKLLLPKELSEHQIAEGQRLAKSFSLNLKNDTAKQ